MNQLVVTANIVMVVGDGSHKLVGVAIEQFCTIRQGVWWLARVCEERGKRIVVAGDDSQGEIAEQW